MRTAPPREVVGVVVGRVEEENARRKEGLGRYPRRSERDARMMVLASSVGSQDIAPPSAGVRLTPILLLTRAPPQRTATSPKPNQREAADAATTEDPSLVVARMTRTNLRPSCQKTSR